MKDNHIFIDYLNALDNSLKEVAIQYHTYILKCLPELATFKISYKMPTYYLNGNIIHFAVYKNHVGIYPGTKAIENFKNELINYETSKGAIKIPLHDDVPTKLIKKLIAYNIDSVSLKKKTIDWNKYDENWIEYTALMQKIMSKTVLVKEIKWGGEVYTYKSNNVIGWRGFKNFFSVWFYNGVFLSDPYKVLVNANEEKTKSLRQWRFTKNETIDVDKILRYVNEAIQTVEDGKKIKSVKNNKLEVKGLFKEFLEDDDLFLSAFNNLSTSKQNEYIRYIDEAKQEKTKINRISKIKPLILNCKGLNDRYTSK